MSNASVFIGADHRGYRMKSQLIGWLKQHGYDPQDLGTNSEERCDAFDFATKVAAELKKNPGNFGILICGSGHAMAMTANRYKDIRAAHCLNADLAKLSREHNDANVVVIGADFTDDANAQKIVEVFLATKFLGGRYAERRDKLTQLGGL